METIGGLTVVEYGDILIAPWTAECLVHCKDTDGHHAMLFCQISSNGVGFFLSDYDIRVLGKPNLKNAEWKRNYFRTLTRDNSREIILNRQDYNAVSRLLTCGAVREITCSRCHQTAVTDWFYYKGFCCADCIESEKTAENWHYPSPSGDTSAPSEPRQLTATDDAPHEYYLRLAKQHHLLCREYDYKNREERRFYLTSDGKYLLVTRSDRVANEHSFTQTVVGFETIAALYADAKHTTEIRQGFIDSGFVHIRSQGDALCVTVDTGGRFGGECTQVYPIAELLEKGLGYFWEALHHQAAKDMLHTNSIWDGLSLLAFIHAFQACEGDEGRFKNAYAVR